MAACFFDTCALVPRYRLGKFTHRVNRVFAGRKDIFIAEITAVEIVSAFGSVLRANNLSQSEFDRMNAEFLDDIEAGRIQVRALTRGDMMRARHLLSLAGVVNRRNLKSSDALVAVSCRELALEKRERATFYTKDWTLYATLYEINAFRAALRMRFFGAGRGGIPPSTT